MCSIPAKGSVEKADNPQSAGQTLKPRCESIVCYFLAGLPREPGEAVRYPLPHVQPEAGAVARRQDGAGVHMRPGMFAVFKHKKLLPKL